ELPEMLYERVIEVDERLGADGTVVGELDEAGARRSLELAYAEGIRSVAIVFVHGYRYPDHEARVATIAREVGFGQISTSHGTSPLMKLVSRGDTTVVDAYLTPILRRYVDRVAGELGDTRLMFMQSSGGLADAGFFQGKDSILSGPAGGIVGAVRTAASAGIQRLITFDMGGTSTDVAHYDGEYERAFETLVAGVRMRAPMMHIHTVAAGGGSLCRFDGARFRVGPESAGADPGPACYRRGGPLAVTDCNVMVGKIQPQFFPRVFGPAQDQSLDREVVVDALGDLAARIRQETGVDLDPVEVADGFLKIAVENMAGAIKQISTQRGHDVTGYTLCCFGGAGGQHACLVADALGMTTVLIHPFAGVLSAYGMGLADLRLLKEQAVEAPLDKGRVAELEDIIARLAQQGRAEMARQGVAGEHIETVPRLRVRYQGSDTPLEVDFADLAAIRSGFEIAHRSRYGFLMPGKALLVEAVAVEVIGQAQQLSDELLRPLPREGKLAPLERVHLYGAGEWQQAPVYDRQAMHPGDRVEGPALIIEPNATTVVEPGWQAQVNDRQHLLLTRITPRPRRVAVGTEVDPVMLEVFNNLFMSIAEQMGFTLANTAYSVNIKERLDFSCALFDAQGSLIANAPHMPVHLGSMGESVQAVIQGNPTVQPGDVFALNAPYNGGTHLPDVTVITPVFDQAGQQLLFYVGSRGHHADIGGRTPGSMPPDSRTVQEEGVLIDNFKLVDRGEFREQAILELLGSGPWPARNPQQNLADLQAQIAANQKGVQELRKMVAHFGLEVVQAYMQHVQDNAEEQVRRVLDVLHPGQFAYEMDDGSVVKVAIAIDRDRRCARVDFTGTSPQQDSNFNAPSAVCKAAVLYVFRTLVEDDIPMNAGVLKPIEIVIPAGSMLSPRYPAAVVAGNVETSQCITDALYGALGVMAAAQGTMNNLTFGNDHYQYYETLCGGAGAGADFHGASAVHTHMTNSRLTDPEVLEWRYPVRLEEFQIRQGSGGAGRRRGGDGVVRCLRFLEPMIATILSNRRRIPPFGLEGGQPGARGCNWVERRDGTREELPGTARVIMAAGDRLIVATPGGGGFGG
ncbi:MAG: hydantoinase B/oxoprolinase family protein, partial [Candidatus Competibacteraceae bacterium]|nr:hydantoinase B/oxoprolinase family protein [Candidatus Competibacteraceae bacterium]